MRAAALDLSALSPAEYDNWSDWHTFIASSEITDLAVLLNLAYSAVDKSVQRDLARDRELLAFFRQGANQPGPAEFLALLRLITHAQSCSTLCRDSLQSHIHRAFIRSQGNESSDVIIQQSINPVTLQAMPPPRALSRAASVKSNPFRRLASDPVNSNPQSNVTEAADRIPRFRSASATPISVRSMSESNPFKAKPMSDIETSRTSPSILSVSSPATTVSSGPPLPPRKVIEPPPKRAEIASGLTRSSTMPSRLNRTLNIISSSDSGQSLRTTLANNSLFGTKPPSLAPEPKLVTSTHIGPATRLRPVQKHGTGISTIMTDEDSKSLTQSSSSSSANEFIQSSQHVPSWTDDYISRPKLNKLDLSKPPPPPKRSDWRSPTSLSSATISSASPLSSLQAPVPITGLDFRSLRNTSPNKINISPSVHQEYPSKHIQPLARNRPIDELLDKPLERTQDWVNKAKERIEARVGNKKEREGLIDVSSEEDDDLLIDDGIVNPKELSNGWSRL